LGEPIDNLLYLPMPQPVSQDGTTTGQVVYQDVYGNLVTNISADRLPAIGSMEVRIKGRRIIGLSRTFNDGSHVGEDGLIALTASHGYLEVALPNGSAAELLSAGEGEVVQVVSSSD
jgi:S-adenosylmethionine hydrolase